MAKSYKDMARRVQKKGAQNSPNDSMLAHITPREASLLEMMGGSGHTDPHTGLRHYDDSDGSSSDSGDTGPGDSSATDASSADSVNGSDSMSDSFGGGVGGFGGDGSFGGVSPDAFADLGQVTMDGWGLPGFTPSEAETFGFSPAFADPNANNMSLMDAFKGPASEEEDNALGKFAKGFLSFMSHPVVSTIGKMADKSGLFGPAMNVANIANKGATAPSLAESNAAVGKGFGSTLGSMLGAVAGPVGALAGGYVGGKAGESLGGVTANQGMSGVPGQGTDGLGGGMIGDVAQGLAGLYMGNRATGQYNQTLGNLNNIFSPNGVYAQQLRQQLERRDAASGRRSQYGPREAQLMAALAEKQASTLSSPGYANLMQQRGNAQNQGLNTILALMAKNPGALAKAGRFVGNGIDSVMNGGGLGALFNGGYSNAWDMPADSGPQLPDSFLGDNWWGGGEGYFGE